MRDYVKKTLLGLLLLLFVTGLYAQKDSSKRYDFQQGSEVSVSYGYDYFRFWTEDNFSSNQWLGAVNTPWGTPNPFNNYFEGKEMRKGPTSISGAINLTYTYRFKRWFELSGRFTYSGVYSDYYSFSDNTLLYKQHIHTVSTVVVARFVWLNRKYIRLYSSIGLGVGAVIESGGSGSNAYYFTPAVDFTYFGIKAGKDIYGFAELSVGASGLVSAGIGFNLSKWRK